MRVKVRLNPNRDLELVAIMCNPTLNFTKIATEAVRAHVRKKEFYFQYVEGIDYRPRSLVCYVNFDDEADADIVDYINQLTIPRSVFIRNIMLRSLKGTINDIYTDHDLKNQIDIWKLKRDMEKYRSRLKKKNGKEIRYE